EPGVGRESTRKHSRRQRITTDELLTAIPGEFDCFGRGCGLRSPRLDFGESLRKLLPSVGPAGLFVEEIGSGTSSLVVTAGGRSEVSPRQGRITGFAGRDRST